jgi:hypothetical protein
MQLHPEGQTAAAAVAPAGCLKQYFATAALAAVTGW